MKKLKKGKMKKYIVMCHKCKQQSTMDNILIVSSIIEKRRQEKESSYVMCADPVKCFDKLWLKGCLIEMKELGYSSNDIKILY